MNAGAQYVKARVPEKASMPRAVVGGGAIPRSPMAGLAVFCITSMLVPVMAVSDFGDSRSQWLTLFLAYVAVLYPSLQLSQIIARGWAQWPYFMFWAFAYIWIGLAGWSQAFSRMNPYTLAFEDATLQMASILALVGMAACHAGFFFASTRGRSSISSQSEMDARELNPRRVVLFSIAVLLAVPIIIDRIGGWQTLLVTRSERSDSVAVMGLSLAQTGLYSAGVFAAPLVASVALIVLMRNGRGRAKRPAWVLLLLCVVGMTLFVNNPISNPRYIAGTVLLAIILGLGVGESGARFRLAAFGILSVLTLVFPYSDVFRVANSNLSLRPLSYFLVSKGDYDTATQLANAIDFRSATGGTGGQQLLTALLFFVPRSEWSEKGDATGALLAEYQNYRYRNVSSPLWTEAYVDFGLIGVAVLFFALGWALCRLCRMGQSAKVSAPGWSGVAVPVLAAYSLLVYRGALLTAIGPLAVLILLPLLLVRRPTKKPA